MKGMPTVTIKQLKNFVCFSTFSLLVFLPCIIYPLTTIALSVSAVWMHFVYFHIDDNSVKRVFLNHRKQKTGEA